MKLLDEDYRIHALLLGDSGTGKTGSIASLVAAGYKVYLLDLENGSRILGNMVQQKCPDRLDSVELEKVTTTYTLSAKGATAKKASHGLAKVALILDKWQKECSPNDIIVIDSVTALGRLCLVWAQAQTLGIKDRRQYYFNAQQVLEPIIATLTSDEFPCHSLLLTHIDYRDMGGGTKGFASSVGSALGDKIPTYFNEVFRYDTLGTGSAAKRVISSTSNGVVDVKNTVPYRIKGQFNLDTGLATIFQQLLGK